MCTVESGNLSDAQKEELIKRFDGSIFRNYESTAGVFCLPRSKKCLMNFGIGGKTIDKVKAEYIRAHQ